LQSLPDAGCLDLPVRKTDLPPQKGDILLPLLLKSFNRHPFPPLQTESPFFLLAWTTFYCVLRARAFHPPPRPSRPPFILYIFPLFSPLFYPFHFSNRLNPTFSQMSPRFRSPLRHTSPSSPRHVPRAPKLLPWITSAFSTSSSSASSISANVHGNPPLPSTTLSFSLPFLFSISASIPLFLETIICLTLRPSLRNWLEGFCPSLTVFFPSSPSKFPDDDSTCSIPPYPRKTSPPVTAIVRPTDGFADSLLFSPTIRQLLPVLPESTSIRSPESPS